MKRLIIVILGMILCIGLFAGCGKQEPTGSGNSQARELRKELSGSWIQISGDEGPSLPEMGIPSGYVFYLDGTGIDTFWDMTFTYSADGEKMHIAYDDSIGEDWDYLYTIEGDRLTMTRVDDGAISMVYQREKETEAETESEAETEAAAEEAEANP